jgi:hypothetical protein
MVRAGDRRDPSQRMPYNRDQNGRPAARARPNDPLMQEVRWRLFRREDMPARLRRLQRLEDTALSERSEDGQSDRDAGESRG